MASLNFRLARSSPFNAKIRGIFLPCGLAGFSQTSTNVRPEEQSGIDTTTAIMSHTNNNHTVLNRIAHCPMIMV